MWCMMYGGHKCVTHQQKDQVCKYGLRSFAIGTSEIRYALVAPAQEFFVLSAKAISLSGSNELVPNRPFLRSNRYKLL